MTRDETLILLIEECGEVIQAATKCLRFGFERDWPGYGVNHEELAKEVGELIGVADALKLNKHIVEQSRQTKMKRAEEWKDYFVTHPIDVTT